MTGRIGHEKTPPADLAPEFFRDYFHRAAMGHVLLALVMQPVNWFFMLLTAECYRRFKAARSGNIITAAPGSITT